MQAVFLDGIRVVRGRYGHGPASFGQAPAARRPTVRQSPAHTTRLGPTHEAVPRPPPQSPSPQQPAFARQAVIRQAGADPCVRTDRIARHRCKTCRTGCRPNCLASAAMAGSEYAADPLAHSANVAKATMADAAGLTRKDRRYDRCVYPSKMTGDSDSGGRMASNILALRRIDDAEGLPLD